MSRSATILRNVASNFGGFAVNAAVTLLLTPVVLRELGSARYGIWILTSSIIGYYGLLDLGFRSGVTQHLTRYAATREYDKCSECLSSAVAALAVLGLLMMALSVGAAFAAPHWFELPAESSDEAFWCILVVGFSAAVQFTFTPFMSVFMATQRFDLANAIGVLTRLLTAVSVIVALRMGWGLIGVSLATASSNLVDYLLRWRVATGLAPDLEVSRRYVVPARIREMGSFGIWNFFISINAYVYQHVPTILIGAFMPIAAVGHFALATGLSRQVNSLMGPISQVMYPAAAELHAQGDHARLERLYHEGSRLMMLVMVPVVLIAELWATDFYRLWIGAGFLDGQPYPSVALLFRILLVGTVTTYTTNIAAQVLMGAGRVRTVASVLITGSIITVGLALGLVGPYGLIGMAIAIVAASVIGDLLIVPILAHGIMGLSVGRFLRRACIRPIMAGIVQLILLALIRLGGQREAVDSWVVEWIGNGGFASADWPARLAGMLELTLRPSALNWVDLVIQGLSAGATSLAVLMLIGLTRAERARFIGRPLQRMFRFGVPANQVGRS